MNTDLIRELTVRALAQCDPAKMTELASSVDNGDNTVIPLEFAEQLVNIVVRECITECEANSWIALNGWQRAKQIKQRFGVE